MNPDRGVSEVPPQSDPGNPFSAIMGNRDRILTAITGKDMAMDLSGVTLN